MQDNRNRSRVMEHISFLTKGLLEFVNHSLVEDSKLILCFACSLGTGIGLALLALYFFISETGSVALSYLGLLISTVCCSIFLYAAWKMD
jgi:hypothetical protein